MAGGITLHNGGKAAHSLGIPGHFTRITAHGGHGGRASKHSRFAAQLRRLEAAIHALHTRHGAPHRCGRNLQPESIARLQQDAFRAAQALAQGAVGGLAKIAPLGVLAVGAPGHQRDIHVCNGRACQHTCMHLFGQMRQNQALPVFVQHVLAARAGKMKPAAARGGFQQKVHLGVMAQRLEMPHALHRGGNGLFI